jgi:hypothetical protein
VKSVTVQTLKLRGQRYVLLRERDFNTLKQKAQGGKSRKSSSAGSRTTRRLTAQDRGDITEAMRRLNDPDDKEVSYEQARKRLGLA